MIDKNIELFRKHYEHYRSDNRPGIEIFFGETYKLLEGKDTIEADPNMEWTEETNTRGGTNAIRGTASELLAYVVLHGMDYTAITHCKDRHNQQLGKDFLIRKSKWKMEPSVSVKTASIQNGVLSLSNSVVDSLLGEQADRLMFVDPETTAYIFGPHKEMTKYVIRHGQNEQHHTFVGVHSLQNSTRGTKEHYIGTGRLQMTEEMYE